MTDETVDRAFRQHPSFEKSGEAEFEYTATPFEGVVTVSDSEDADDDATREYRVVVRAPVLDAVVEGETVAEVVRSGWFETLERRLADAHTVTRTESASPPDIRRAGEEVVVVVTFAREDPEYAAEDAQAVVDYVEGTWVQGIIPGYDYREPAAGLLERATENYDDDGQTGPSGAPPL
ncbi:DUF5813 family protein [Halorussus salilacus]|uniref:DUF5813 family protein n=1 Tax=Halorussus salilacus TaxID=2953750 RepID=UPI0020A2053A|nr:DUF5813 family protein [Halorussus salilacus]USZ67622.1 DUF5813 family protein [Halorussus salilacus]